MCLKNCRKSEIGRKKTPEIGSRKSEFRFTSAGQPEQEILVRLLTDYITLVHFGLQNILEPLQTKFRIYIANTNDKC